MKKAPNDVDRHVGARVRMRRQLIAMSQEKLGEALGITFQQVQKYEKGTNRISASRLQHIAGILGVSVEYLYAGNVGEGAPPPGGFADSAGAPYDADMVSSDGAKLLRAFQKIPDARMRRKVIDIATLLSETPPDPKDDRSV